MSTQMNIEITEKGQWHVASFEGYLDTTTAPDAETGLSKLLDDGVTNIIVDFSKLDYISSAGLRILFSAAKRIKNVSGKFRICSLNETVEDVFEMSGFNTILSVFSDQAEALK